MDATDDTMEYVIISTDAISLFGHCIAAAGQCANAPAGGKCAILRSSCGSQVGMGYALLTWPMLLLFSHAFWRRNVMDQQFADMFSGPFAPMIPQP